MACIPCFVVMISSLHGSLLSGAGDCGDGAVEGFAAACGFGAGIGQVDGDVVRDAAGVGREDEDAGGEEDGFGDGVGDEEDGPVLFFAEAEKLFVHAVAGHLVEGGEGLVEEEEAGARGEGAGDGDAHLHAAGELAGVGVGDV